MTSIAIIKRWSLKTSYTVSPPKTIIYFILFYLFSFNNHLIAETSSKNILFTDKIPHVSCNHHQIDTFNNKIIPILTKLRNFTFFRIFRVSLNNECKLWPANKICSHPECEVCPCEQDDIPILWRKEFGTKTNKIDRKIQFGLLKWENNKDTWITEEDPAEKSYIDLSINPHQDTGYSGKSAWRIWSTIYGENCLNANDKNIEEKCQEDKVFFRIISGMHSSVTTHIAAKNFKSKSFRYNLIAFKRRLGLFPDRINNIYFAYTFLLRAIGKARLALKEYPYATGNESEDMKTISMIDTFFVTEGLDNITKSFNEKNLFDGDFFNPKIKQYKSKFRKISQILNCVECEKCRLYGKLQVMGLGTALKIMFAEDSQKCLLPSFFQRDEIMALIATFGEFSDSLSYIQNFYKLERTYFVFGFWLMFSAVIFMIYLWIFIHRSLQRCLNFLATGKEFKN